MTDHEKDNKSQYLKITTYSALLIGHSMTYIRLYYAYKSHDVTEEETVKMALERK